MAYSITTTRSTKVYVFIPYSAWCQAMAYSIPPTRSTLSYPTIPSTRLWHTLPHWQSLRLHTLLSLALGYGILHPTDKVYVFIPYSAWRRAMAYSIPPTRSTLSYPTIPSAGLWHTLPHWQSLRLHTLLSLAPGLCHSQLFLVPFCLHFHINGTKTWQKGLGKKVPLSVNFVYACTKYLTSTKLCGALFLSIDGNLFGFCKCTVTTVELIHCVISYAICSVGEILYMGMDLNFFHLIFFIHDKSFAVLSCFWLTFFRLYLHYYT